MKKSFLKTVLALTALFGLEAVAETQHYGQTDILSIYSEGLRCKGTSNGYARDLIIYTQADIWGHNKVNIPALIRTDDLIFMGHYSGVFPLKKAGDTGVLYQNADGYWRLMSLTVTANLEIQGKIIEANETETYSCVDLVFK